MSSLILLYVGIVSIGQKCIFGTTPEIRMFYGHYLVDGTDRDSEEYYNIFRNSVTDILSVEDALFHMNTEVVAAPMEIEIGRFDEYWMPLFFHNVDGTYSELTNSGTMTVGRPEAEDLRIFKEKLLNENGPDGVDYYNNFIESGKLSYALIKFPSADYDIDETVGAIVDITGNTLHFYNFSYNSDYTVDVLDEFYSCQVDFAGAKLEIGYEDARFEYVPYDFRAEQYCDYIYCGPFFVDDTEDALAGICGMSVADDENDHLYVPHGFFVTGEESFGKEDKQTFEYDIETGEFTLTYAINYTFDGQFWNIIDDPEYRHVSGNFIWGGYEHGLILKANNNWHYYQASREEYYSDIFGFNGMGSDDDNNSIAGSIAIHDQISNDLSIAFGNDALVDDNSGAVTMESNILFAVDSTEISDEGKAYLDDFIVTYVNTIKPYLDDGSVTSIVIEGHTDPDGSYEYNLDLSERRAQAVANYVISQQPELEDVIETIGYSYLYPVLDENGEVDKPASRRVVFSFVSK